MSWSDCGPVAGTGAESAEVRELKLGAGSGAVGECGKSAEKVRNLSQSSCSVPVSSVPAPLPPSPALSLVRTLAEKLREVTPAPPPAWRGAGAEGVSSAGFEYLHRPWGELIYGSKAELQALGLAVGMAFPGEAGCPRGDLVLRDPRGYQARIFVCGYRGGAAFGASIRFPGRCPPDFAALSEESYAPGVRLRRGGWLDEYRGTAGDLAAAGLLLLEHLPGQPGMRKMRVTIHADGTVAGGAPTAPNPRAREPGARSIQRGPGGGFLVRVVVTPAESERRDASRRAAEIEWERRMAALPRPAPLSTVQGNSAERSKPQRDLRVRRPGGRLVLVWDAGPLVAR